MKVTEVILVTNHYPFKYLKNFIKERLNKTNKQ